MEQEEGLEPSSAVDVGELRPEREIGGDDESAWCGGVEAEGSEDPPQDVQATPTQGGKKKTGLGVFKMFQKKKRNTDRQLQELTVDSLPQSFVTKYVGCRPCEGLWGIQCVRGPLEQLIESVQQDVLAKGHDLPLMVLQVTATGLQLQVHKHNKAPQPLPQSCFIPIEFISYAVQDIQYTRMLTFILVREMSYKQRVTEVHAYLCDSVLTARRLALAISKAFQDYAKGLKGKPFRFQVDLRSTQELEQDLESGLTEEQTEAEEEC